MNTSFFGAAIGIAMGLYCFSHASGTAGEPPSSSLERRYARMRLPQWQERIKNVDPQSSGAAALVDPLIAIIQDESLPGVDREPFAAYLARIGRPARRAVPYLAQMIDRRHEDPHADYLWAARALALMGEAANEATPSLVALLFDNRLPVRNRQSAVEALALIGPSHPDAIPAILRLLQLRPSGEISAADASFMRFLAAECVFIAGPECGELAAPLLIRMIRDRRESEQVRRSAIVAIGSLKQRGAVAQDVLLEELVHGRAPALRDAAAVALVNLGSTVIPRINQCLNHPDPEVRWRVAYQLRTLDVSQEQVAANLVSLFADSHALVQICAAESVFHLYGKSDRVLTQAVQLLQAEDRMVRLRAKKLIVEMRPIGAKHRRELQQLLGSEKKHVAGSAKATLDQLLPE